MSSDRVRDSPIDKARGRIQSAMGLQTAGRSFTPTVRKIGANLRYFHHNLIAVLLNSIKKHDGIRMMAKQSSEAASLTCSIF